MTPLVSENQNYFKLVVQNVLIPVAILLVFSGCSEAIKESEKIPQKPLVGKQLLLNLFGQDQVSKFPNDTEDGLTIDHRFGFAGVWYEFSMESPLTTDREKMVAAFRTAWKNRRFKEFPELEEWLAVSVPDVVSRCDIKSPNPMAETSTEDYKIEVHCVRMIQNVYNVYLRFEPTS